MLCSVVLLPGSGRQGLWVPPEHALDDAPQTQQEFSALLSPHHSACGLMPHFLHAAHACLPGRIINFLVSFLTLPVMTQSEG